jgi:hypothetical protein
VIRVPEVAGLLGALERIVEELAELRRSVDHLAVMTARPELYGRASGFYADHHSLVHRE